MQAGPARSSTRSVQLESLCVLPPSLAANALTRLLDVLEELRLVGIEWHHAVQHAVGQRTLHVRHLPDGQGVPRVTITRAIVSIFLLLLLLFPLLYYATTHLSTGLDPELDDGIRSEACRHEATVATATCHHQSSSQCGRRK